MENYILNEQIPAQLKKVEGKIPSVLSRMEGTLIRYGKPGRNKRLYERELWERVLTSEDVKDAISKRMLIGELDHPKDRVEVKLANASHIITEMKLNEKNQTVEGIIEILNTPKGQILNTLLDAGSQVGISSRGVGKLTPVKGVDYSLVETESYKFVTFDFVQNPSYEEARPTIVKEWNEQSIYHLVRDSVMNTSAAELAVLKPLTESSDDLRIMIEEREAVLTEEMNKYPVIFKRLEEAFVEIDRLKKEKECLLQKFEAIQQPEKQPEKQEESGEETKATEPEVIPEPEVTGIMDPEGPEAIDPETGFTGLTDQEQVEFLRAKTAKRFLEAELAKAIEDNRLHREAFLNEKRRGDGLQLTVESLKKQTSTPQYKEECVEQTAGEIPFEAILKNVRSLCERKDEENKTLRSDLEDKLLVIESFQTENRLLREQYGAIKQVLSTVQSNETPVDDAQLTEAQPVEKPVVEQPVEKKLLNESPPKTQKVRQEHLTEGQVISISQSMGIPENQVKGIVGGKKFLNESDLRVHLLESSQVGKVLKSFSPSYEIQDTSVKADRSPSQMILEKLIKGGRTC